MLSLDGTIYFFFFKIDCSSFLVKLHLFYSFTYSHLLLFFSLFLPYLK